MYGIAGFLSGLVLATILQSVSIGAVPDFRDAARWTPLLDRKIINVMEDDQGNPLPWSSTLFYRSTADRKSEGMEMILFWRGEEIAVYRRWKQEGVSYHALLKNASERNTWTNPVRGLSIEFVGRIARGQIENIVFMIYDGDAPRPYAHLAFSDPDTQEETPVFTPSSRRVVDM